MDSIKQAQPPTTFTSRAINMDQAKRASPLSAFLVRGRARPSHQMSGLDLARCNQ